VAAGPAAPDQGAIPSGLVQPWRWRDPATLKVRQPLFGGHYWRKSLGLTLGPTGVGKSSYVLTELCAAASGKPLLGVAPPSRLKCFYLAAQDGRRETDRRIAAVSQHYGLGADDLEGWLFTGSTLDWPMRLEEPGRHDEFNTDWFFVELMVALRKQWIDLAVFDPFAWLHRCDENDNNAIARLAEAFADLAVDAYCEVELVHHTGKRAPGGEGFEVGDGRGASALLAAARSARVLNPLSKAQAARAGVTPSSAFRVDIGKASFAPLTGDPSWFRLEDVQLPNGDRVGVPVPWSGPDRADEAPPKKTKPRPRSKSR
jgi:RecA-family ATPase